MVSDSSIVHAVTPAVRIIGGSPTIRPPTGWSRDYPQVNLAPLRTQPVRKCMRFGGIARGDLEALLRTERLANDRPGDTFTGDDDLHRLVDDVLCQPPDLA